MALSDHLRELRARILKIALILALGLAAALFFFDPLFDLIYDPTSRPRTTSLRAAPCPPPAEPAPA